jgi:hypothetical protein
VRGHLPGPSVPVFLCCDGYQSVFDLLQKRFAKRAQQVGIGAIRMMALLLVVAPVAGKNPENVMRLQPHPAPPVSSEVRKDSVSWIAPATLQA